jgi:alpha,alpha-trehalase
MQSLFQYKFLLVLLTALLLTCCQNNANHPQNDLYQNFEMEVQMQPVFSDSKTFMDCLPRIPKDSILILYELHKSKPDFDLKKFVHQHFKTPTEKSTRFKSDPDVPVNQHINKLWEVLTRKDTIQAGTLLPLPYSYVVPGGRFTEIYYWDSYFTMLGLETDKQYELIENMIRNFAFLINKYGFIPNGNRTYFLTRSQPPFFSLMVELLAEIKGDAVVVEYLPELKKEYEYWMKGEKQLNAKNPVLNHLVRLEEGEILNRYWDRGNTPRPESYREDSLLTFSSKQEYRELYRNLRSSCESGWDFSSRWFADNCTLSTIETTSILPVDLNVLLWNLERVIHKGYLLAEDRKSAEQFRQKAETRKRLIRKVFWNDETKFFMDYHFVTKRHTPCLSLAGVFPLFSGLATQEQAHFVAIKIEEKFLRKYGLVTTLKATGEQWDYPNGWAPLQWITIKGLQNYRFHSLARESASRWIQCNIEGYRKNGKLVEKYDVVNGIEGQGGEYPTQDGFGWTNGVLQKLLLEYPEKIESIVPKPEKLHPDSSSHRQGS